MRGDAHVTSGILSRCPGWYVPPRIYNEGFRGLLVVPGLGPPRRVERKSPGCSWKGGAIVLMASRRTIQPRVPPPTTVPEHECEPLIA
jgi:hypothetical protein